MLRNKLLSLKQFLESLANGTLVTITVDLSQQSDLQTQTR